MRSCFREYAGTAYHNDKKETGPPTNGSVSSTLKSSMQFSTAQAPSSGGYRYALPYRQCTPEAPETDRLGENGRTSLLCHPQSLLYAVRRNPTSARPQSPSGSYPEPPLHRPIRHRKRKVRLPAVNLPSPYCTPPFPFSYRSHPFRPPKNRLSSPNSSFLPLYPVAVPRSYCMI